MMLFRKIGFIALLLTTFSGYSQQVAKAVNCQLVSSPGTKIVINGGITFIGTSNWKDSGETFIQKNTIGGFGSENWMDSTAAGVYDINSIGKVNFISDSFQYIYGNTKFYNLRSASDSGVYINSNIEVRNQFNLDKSLFYTSPATKIYVSNTAINAIQSSNSFASSWIHGRLERAANIASPSQYLFPVGKIKGSANLYAPVQLAKYNTNTARYQVEYFPTIPPNQANINAGKINHISYVEYWEIASNIASGQDDDAVVALSWRGYSHVSATATVRDSLMVAQYVNAPPLWWDVPGNWGGTVNVSGPDSLSGYVKSNSFIGSFIPAEKYFTLGTLSPYNDLPVKLIYFTAVADGNKVRLDWNVNQEQDVRTYEIERSFTGIAYTSIGSVTSLQKTIPWLYTDYDYTPATGWNYYRLKIIDKTGKISYSEVRKVKFEKGLQLVKLFPVPALTTLTILLPDAYVNKTTLQLYSIDGKFIATLKASNAYIQLNVAPLPAAVYFLRLLKDGETENYYFIKQ